jgi:hypothetical protein
MSQPKSDTLTRVVAAMTELGAATAADIAEHAGLAYPTVTPRLRALETAGRAQRQPTDDRRTQWRLTSHTPASERTANAAAPSGTAKATARKTATRKQTTRTADDQSSPATSTTNGDPAAGRASGGKTSTRKNAKSNGPAGTRAPAAGRKTGATPARGGSAAPDSPSPATRAPRRNRGGASAASADRTTAQPPATTGPATGRRGKGVLRDEVLAVMQSHPGRAYKVGDLAKLLTASAGAVANALHKLAHDGTARQTLDHPATYQAV